MTFEALGFSEKLLNIISRLGYEAPTPIQEQVIPSILEGQDILGCAQTGTGKTASFTLPITEKLTQGRARARMPRALILEPTRELATQVADSFASTAEAHKLEIALLTGGSTMTDQVKKLDRGVDVIIATPGRLLDLFERGKILMMDIKFLVIDEADRMMDMGFLPSVEEIVSHIPKNRQTLLFSATMAPEIKKVSTTFLNNPKEVSVAVESSVSKTITQRVVHVAPLKKREMLRHLLRTENDTRKTTIVFCNRKKDVDILVRSLEKHGFSAKGLHGDLAQSSRTTILEAVREGEVKILVASDVAARGIDVADITHVFNFDVPIHPEDYVHRIGRTGRAGREGFSYTFVSDAEKKALKAIESVIDDKISVYEIELPKTVKSSSGHEILTFPDTKDPGFGPHVPFFMTLSVPS